MREILFRGKRTDTGKWIEGFYCRTPRWTLNNIPVSCIIKTDGIVFHEIIPETVGQYTGLTDKNGTKIFEGDILSGYLDDLFPEEESRYEVIWHDYGWHIRSNGFLDTPDNGWLKENFEVIGNIHDNPELLEVAEND